MSESFLDYFRVDICGEQKRSRGVTKIMKADV
jgi:hypothetical protein